jgi:hypothetical protein
LNKLTQPFSADAVSWPKAETCQSKPAASATRYGIANLMLKASHGFLKLDLD